MINKYLQGLGLVQAGATKHWVNKMIYFFIFLLVVPKYEGWKKISFLSIPEVGEKQKA